MRATNPPLASSGMTDCSFRWGQSSLLEHEAQRLEADRRGYLLLDESFGEQLEAPVLADSRWPTGSRQRCPKLLVLVKASLGCTTRAQVARGGR